MKLNKAISLRIYKLCDEYNIPSINELANRAIVTQSTLENVVNCKYDSVKSLVLFNICEGFGISLKEFFDDEIFDKVERNL